MQVVHLDGAEEVRSAGHRISGAADTMRSAADTMDSAAVTIKDAAALLADALVVHARFMDDWLTRFEAAAQRASDRGL